MTHIPERDYVRTATLRGREMFVPLTHPTGRDPRERPRSSRPERPPRSHLRFSRRDRIFSLLGEGERKLLTLLIAVYPESLSRIDLAAQGGYSNAKSGGFAGPLARLVELGFVDAVKNGVVRGSEMLFLKGKVRSR